MFITQHLFRRTLAGFLLGLLTVPPLLAQKFVGEYTFISLATGKGIEGSSSKVHVFYPNKSDYAKWSIRPTDIRVGDKRTFTIRSVATGKCLDGDQGRLYVSDCNGGNYQTWLIEPTDKPGYVWITSMATGKVVDGDADKLYPGDKNGGDYQKWRMDLVSGETINSAPPARIEAPPANSDPRTVHRSFRRNMTFARGSSINSKDGRFQLAFQDDGNMVLYRLTDQPKKAYWASNTNGRAVKEFKFQEDGNLVLYSYNGKPIWASNTDGRGDYMLLQNDGNLVIYDSRNKAIWASNTNE